MGYEMYRLLALSVPSLGGNKMASKRRKPAKNQQPQGDTTINLDETEREMDALIGMLDEHVETYCTLWLLIFLLFLSPFVTRGPTSVVSSWARLGGL